MSLYDIWMVFFILNYYFWKIKILLEYNLERSKNLIFLLIIFDIYCYILIELFIKFVWVNGGFDFCNFYRYLNFGCCLFQDWFMDMNVYGVYLIMGFNKRILNILYLFYYYKLVNNSFFIVFRVFV